GARFPGGDKTGYVHKPEYLAFDAHTSEHTREYALNVVQIHQPSSTSASSSSSSLRLLRRRFLPLVAAADRAAFSAAAAAAARKNASCRYLIAVCTVMLLFSNSGLRSGFVAAISVSRM